MDESKNKALLQFALLVIAIFTVMIIVLKIILSNG